jgi:hypothetical protein
VYIKPYYHLYYYKGEIEGYACYKGPVDMCEHHRVMMVVVIVVVIGMAMSHAGKINAGGLYKLFFNN